MNNPEVFYVPIGIETVDNQSVNLLIAKRIERMAQLKDEGWQPSGGWVNEPVTSDEVFA